MSNFYATQRHIRACHDFLMINDYVCIIEFVNEILSVYCRFVLSDYCQQMTPKLSGSRFRVQARPDATGCGYEIIFTFYGLGFPLPHLDITGLGQWFKGYNRWILLPILIKIWHTRYNPMSDTDL
jgi:hypothetical protein